MPTCSASARWVSLRSLPMVVRRSGKSIASSAQNGRSERPRRGSAAQRRRRDRFGRGGVGGTAMPVAALLLVWS
jgi:hypothetical protein